MDSYHRSEEPEFVVGTVDLGAATLEDVNQETSGSILASYFSVHYEWNGETIISFRGTDNPAIDLIFGWTNGAGLITPNSQLYYAVEFYNQVTGGTLTSGAEANTTLVGHSLGGGLAGIISALTGTDAVVFDHMPFGPTAALMSLVDVVPVSADSIHGYYVEGEINQAVRAVAPVVAAGIYGNLPIIGPVVGPVVGAIAAALESAALDNSPIDAELPTYGGLRSPIDLHMPGLPTILLYAATEGHTDWHAAGAPFMDALFDNDVAVQIGVGAHSLSNEWDSMQRMIAYSAIDEGARPFGDTGIRALFDDADALGKALADPHSSTLDEAAKGIAEVFVQFAGQLAAREVLLQGHAGVDDGVIALSPDEQVLVVDFSDALWAIEGDKPTNIIGRDTIMKHTLGGDFDLDDMRTLMLWLWGTDDTNIISRFAVQTRDGALDTTLPDHAGTSGLTLTGGAEPVTILAAGGSEDNITGSNDNDVIMGGGGADTLNGGDGDDIVVGGGGDDVLTGGAGRNVIIGGAGHDTVVYDWAAAANVTLSAIQGEQIKGIEFSRGGSNIDRLYKTERVALSASGDTVHFNGPGGNIGQKLDVDAGAGTDTLDFSQSPTNVFVGAASDHNGLAIYNKYDPVTQVVQFIFNAMIPGEQRGVGLSGASGLEFVNFEHVIGSTGDDRMGLFHMNPGGPLSPEQEQTLKAARQISGSAQTPAQVGAIFDQRVSAAAAIPQNQTVVEIEGGAGNDMIMGSRIGYNVIEGGAGSDRLIAGGYVSEVYGGAGEDYVAGGGMKSHLYGGDGTGQDSEKDIFSLSNHAFVMDAGTEDYVTWGGSFHLSGGVKQWWMEGNWAYWTPFGSILGSLPFPALNVASAFLYLVDAVTALTFRYAQTDSGQLVVQFGRGRGGQAVIENYEMNYDTGQATGHVVVFQQVLVDPRTATLDSLYKYVSLALKAGFGVGLPGSDPLVLDLDGDGVELIRREASSIYFDVDADGFAERTAWVGADDGLLARDLDSNGRIDNVVELFGDADTPGFTALAALDSNSDGKIDASDAEFASLRVWRDLDGDAYTDAGELQTLTEAGITEISLTNSAPVEDEVLGSTVRAEGSFKRSDNSTGVIADVVLNTDQADSFFIGTESISSAAALLPDLKGYGDMHALRVVMSADATLLSMVEDLPELAEITSWAQMQSAAEAVLYRWAGVDGVTPVALGADFDTRKLAFLESFVGYQLAPRDGSGNPTSVNAAELAGMWRDVLDKAAIRLFAQGTLADLFQDVAYNSESDRFHASAAGDLRDVFAALIAELPGSGAQAVWDELWAPAAAAFAAAMVRPDSYDVKTDYAVQALVAALDQTSSPLTLAELAAGMNLTGLRFGATGADQLSRGAASGLVVYVGGGGADTLTGGVGQDVYVFGSGFGDVVVNDAEAFENGDRLRFATLTADQVTISRDGVDLVVTVNGTSDRVTVRNQFVTPKVTLVGTPITPDYGVEEIQFADGQVLEAVDIAAAIGLGTEASETIDGTGTADEIEGLGGDDILRGGDNGDTYYYTLGDGNDTIDDVMTNPLLSNADALVLLGGITLADLRFERQGAGDDLKLYVDENDSSITIKKQFDYNSLGYTSRFALNQRIEAVFLDSGILLSWFDIQDQVIRTYTTDGADVTYGFGTSDHFYASAGDDMLVGFDGGETYVFGRGSGADTIFDQAQYPDSFVAGLVGHSWGEDDILVFEEGVTLADLEFLRPTDDPDLLIRIVGTDDTITIKDQFDGKKLDLFGLFGVQWFSRIETFKFADNTTLSWEDVLHIITTGTDGEDRLIGDFYADTLDGGAGNDYLNGGDDGDTYMFGVGDGQDTIEDQPGHVIYPAADTLQFKAGVAVGDVTFTRDGETDDLIVSINGTTDQVRIVGQYLVAETGPFGAQAFHQIEQFLWADETLKTWATLAQEIIDASGTSGDDLVVGTHFDDTIRGRAGADTLKGGNGSDTYEFDLGDGADTINDLADNILAANEDVILFGAGILPGDIILERSGASDLILKITGTSDQITIQGQFSYTSIDVRANEIESVVFSEGGNWSAAGIRANYLLQIKTSGANEINGFWSNDILNGGAGDDTLRGGDGSDTYVFDAGFGNDTIEEGVDIASFDDNDSIVFATGYDSTDAVLSRDGDDLTIEFTGSTDSVTIVGQFSHTAYFPGWLDIERVTFGDSVTWTSAQLRQKLLEQAATAGNDVVTGFYTPDTLDGGAGDDTLRGLGGGDTYVFGKGSGNDTIEEDYETIYEDKPDTVAFAANVALSEVTFTRTGDDLVASISGVTDTLTIKDHFVSNGRHKVELFKFADGSVLTAAEAEVNATASQATAGADTINGTTGADVIDGGAGDDVLKGGQGSDTYVFGLGYGEDRIEENGGTNGSPNDRVVFKEGIALADLILSRSGNDMVIQIDGAADKLTIKNQFYSASSTGVASLYRIDSFEFADGSVLSAVEMDARTLAAHLTSGADTAIAFDTADTLDGGAGNDTLKGNAGDDLYRFGRGYGSDVIDETDEAQGDLGDTLAFNADVAPEDIVFVRSGNDLILKISGTTDQVRIVDQFRSADSSGLFGTGRIENFTFAIGVNWTAADVDAFTLQAYQTSGDDSIYGYDIADTLEGGAGNDFLQGKDGSDTYLFGVGDGQDEIDETSSAFGAQSDTLKFKEGVAPEDVHWLRAGDDLIVKIAGTTDQVTVKRQFKSLDSSGLDGADRIERFVFAEGAELTGAEVDVLAFQGQQTSGNDTVLGYDVADVIDGGEGDDTLKGEGGNDSYVFRRGSGQDVIIETSAAFGDLGDRVLFGPDITPADLVLTRSGNHLRIAIVGTGDRLEIREQLRTTDSSDLFGTGRVEKFQFADGAIWTAAQMDTAFLQQSATEGDDTIVGFDSNDTLYGGAGNDTLDGAEGDDAHFGGDGDDVLIGNVGADTFDGGDGVDTLDFTYYTSDVTINLSAGLATFVGGVTESAINIENVITAGGADTLIGSDADNVLSGGAGNDALTGGAGNDRLNGGSGNDTMTGGTGDDTYVVGSASDVVIENADEGIDTIETSITYTIASMSNFENVTLLGSSNLNATGNAAANVLVGNTGANRIDGGAGADTMRGGAGSDTYVVDNVDDVVFELGGEGVDLIESSVSYSLMSAASVENLTLTGSANIDATGSDSWGNTLTGNSGNNRLDGRGGADTMIGGAGNDTYVVDNAGDVVTESGGGTDTVESYITFSIASLSNIENLTLIGSGHVNATGNSGNNTITGNSGNNRIDGGTGDDAHIGGAGDDTLVGNAGLDSFDGGEGTDTLDFTYTSSSVDIDLASGLATFSGGATIETVVNVENVLAGSGNDTITGTSADNVLHGGAGNDTINGGAGNDIINGGDGNDAHNGGDGDDTLIGNVGTDSFDGGDGVDTLDFTYTSSNVAIDLASGLATFSGGSIVETVANIENVLGGSGADTITGTSAANVLDGGAGADTITAGAGDDTLIGAAGNDTLRGNTGADTYRFAPGSGSDVIEDDGSTGTSEVDHIELTGVSAANVALGYANGGLDLTIAISGSSDFITVKNHFATDETDWIEEIRFDDSTVWDRAEIASRAGLPPIVFDLDGDGVELVSRFASNVFFDADNTGVAQRMGWVGPDDGVLALDRNGDGFITSGIEISFLSDHPGARTDLEGLVAFDTNANGSLDAADAQFGDFRIWRDANQDGVSQAAELASLADWNIAAIRLTPYAVAPPAPGADNTVLAETEFVRTDGTIGTAADVKLSFDPDPEALSAPEAQSHRAELARAASEALRRRIFGAKALMFADLHKWAVDSVEDAMALRGAAAETRRRPVSALLDRVFTRKASAALAEDHDLEPVGVSQPDAKLLQMVHAMASFEPRPSADLRPERLHLRASELVTTLPDLRSR
jgi:Ca2+-binding RTX toxin-like protein